MAVEEKVRNCPFSGKPETECVNCLSYEESEMEWQETALVKGEDGRVAEQYTGNRIWGKIGICGLGVFKRKIMEQRLVKEAK